MSTFSCGGGSTMGYKRAGCEVIAANDIDPEMAWHYRTNHNPRHYLLCPIRDLLTATLPPELFDLDILDGSPPCSTFSVAGDREAAWGVEKHFREGQSKQVLSDLFFDFIEVAERLKPRVIVAENVKGMLLGRAKGYTRKVMQRLREIGYRPQLFLVNAADCGVPQTRERVFFCAVREDLNAPPLRLAPTHRWVSVIEATSDLQSLTPEEVAETDLSRSQFNRVWWPLTKPGDNYSTALKRAKLPEKYWNHYRLDGSKPSRTVVSVDILKHWSSFRSLTLREIKRLGSFPDDYAVKSSRVGKYLIGMSVPPKMTEVVARAVCEQWLGKSGQSKVTRPND
jgi:DNA (cytosine-5)-methyltransferase 1